MFIEEKTLSERTGLNLKGWRHKGRFEGYKLYYKASERIIVYDENALFNFIKEQDGKYLRKEGYDMGMLISEWQKNTKIDKAT